MAEPRNGPSGDPSRREAEHDDVQSLAQEARQIALGEIVGIIAHQWRQPLASLQLLLEELRERHRSGALESERLEEIVARGLSTVQQMDETVHDFTHFLRPDREVKAFGVDEAVRLALQLVIPTYRHEGIDVDVEAERGLLVLGHANELAQVLLTLLQNAAEAFSERGTASPRVAVRAAAAGGQAHLTVEDNAGGIPQEARRRLFEPYYTTKEGGTGIGLHLASLIVERSFGGTIEAGNGEHGALIRIALPLASSPQ